jgi:short-subunit dehydrogenase
MIKDIYKKEFPSNLLEGKTILISGSGSGIGRQIAKTFSEFGADLILLSKSLEKLETLYDELKQDYSNNVIIQPLDLEKAEEVDYEEIIRAIGNEYPKID